MRREEALQLCRWAGECAGAGAGAGAGVCMYVGMADGSEAAGGICAT